MSNGQFLHKRVLTLAGYNATGGRTIYLEAPTKTQLDILMTYDDPTTALRIGFAKCHSKENYNKKIGRAYSASRAEYKSFTLESVSFVKGKINYLLSTKKGETILLQGTLNSDKLHFIDTNV